MASRTHRTPEKRLAALRSQLTAAKNERLSAESAWKEYLKLYSQRSNSLPSVNVEDEHLNMGFPSVEVLVATSTGFIPHITATPLKREAFLAAMVAEDAVERWMQRFQIARQWRNADRDAKITGRGWLKTVWDHAATRPDRNPQVSVDEMAAMQADRDATATVLGLDRMPTDDDIYDYLYEKARQIKIGEPRVRRITPSSVWVDPQANSREDWRWICHSYWLPLAAVRADKAYNDRVRNKVQATAWENFDQMWLDTRANVSDGEEKAMERVRIWEMWDIEAQQLIIWADGMDELLFDAPWPYAIGHPFTPIDCFEMPDSPYPAGAIELIRKQMVSVNIVRDELMEARARMQTKYIAYQEFMTDDVRRALDSDVNGDVGIVGETRVPLSQGIHRLDPLDVNPEWYRADGMYMNDAEHILGIGNLQRGQEARGTHRSALEISTLSSFGAARVVPMVENTQAALLDVARKLVGLAQQFMTADDVVHLRGFARVMEDEKELQDLLTSRGAFIRREDVVYPFNRKDISGEFDMRMDVGSATPQTEESRIQKAMTMLQAFAPFPEINRSRLIEEALKAWGIRDIDEFISATPPMGAEPGGVNLPSQAGQASSSPPQLPK